MMFENDPNISDYLKGLVTTRTDISIYGLDYVEGYERAISLIASDEYMKGYNAAVKQHKEKR